MPDMEYRAYVADALKDAGIDAPEKFIDKLADSIERHLKTYDVEWEMDPVTVKEWLESEEPAFRTWLDEKIIDGGWWREDLSIQIRHGIGFALEDGNAFSAWPDIRSWTLEKAGDIADDLVAEIPFPEIRYRFSGPSLRCNICMGTYEDGNREHGTSENLAQWLLDDDPLPLGDYAQLGSLAWLIQSQGKSLDDIRAKNGRFAETLLGELEESCGSCGTPAFCVSLDIDDLEYLKAGGAIEIPASATCGIVEFYGGGGGTMELELEKPIVVDKSLIDEIQIEGAENRFYSVDSIYGLVEECWDTKIRKTEEKPMEPHLFENGKKPTIMDAFVELCGEFDKAAASGWEEGKQHYSDAAYDLVASLHDRGFWYMIPRSFPDGGVSFEGCGFGKDENLEFTAAAKTGPDGLEVSAKIDAGETDAPEIAAALKRCLEAPLEGAPEEKKEEKQAAGARMKS